MFPWSRDAVRLDHSGGDVVGLSAGSRVAFILSTPPGQECSKGTEALAGARGPFLLPALYGLGYAGYGDMRQSRVKRQGLTGKVVHPSSNERK